MKPYKQFAGKGNTIRCVECGLTYYVANAFRTGKWIGSRTWICQECVDEQLERRAPPVRPGRAVRLPFGFHYA